MKKLVSFCLAVIMIFTILPVSAFAAETDQQGCEALINKAATVFPEYAEKLLHPTRNSSYSTQAASPRVLVADEVRPVSATESISLAEYSDGLILLSAYEADDVDYIYEPVGPVPDPSLSVRKYTANITATSVYNGYYGYGYIKGISYTINTGVNVYDKITNRGTVSKGSNCNHAAFVSSRTNESATGYAMLEYGFGFKIGPRSDQFISTELVISVGEDSAVASHSVR